MKLSLLFAVGLLFGACATTESSAPVIAEKQEVGPTLPGCSNPRVKQQGEVTMLAFDCNKDFPGEGRNHCVVVLCSFGTDDPLVVCHAECQFMAKPKAKSDGEETL